YLWAIFVALFAVSSMLWFALLFSALMGLFSSVLGSLNMSVVQLVVPPSMRGRVMAILWATHGLMPLGMIPIGWLAEIWGITFALLTSAVLLASSTFALRVFIPELAKIRRGYDEPTRYKDEMETRDEKYGTPQNLPIAS
ncbi:MAG: MFS transporter, partial [Gammaproteobacteria bacterium]|nr:MFS transporter [Gammaproteobacteria bacterium]